MASKLPKYWKKPAQMRWMYRAETTSPNTGKNEEPYSYAQGWRKENTRKVKEAVSIPVIGVNTIKTPEFAETLLEDGICDFIGLGRGSIADPEWVRKAQTGRSNEIYKCIGCIYCFESLMNVGYVMARRFDPEA